MPPYPLACGGSHVACAHDAASLGELYGKRGDTLNTHLIKAPPQCLDYVLLHEIAHLQEHNHSQRYYAVLERLLPNWKAVRKELEAWSPLVLN